MVVYITATALSILFAYISTHIGNSHQLKSQAKRMLSRTFAFLSFLPLTLISAVRFNVGADFMSYRRMFMVQSFNPTEPGFALFARVLYFISKDPQIFFIASSIFICAGYYIAIYHESVSPAYSIFIFFTTSNCYFSSLNLIRQHMATALLLNALSMYRQKKYKKALILALIATTVHNSSILVVIALVSIDLLKLTPFRGAMVIVISMIATRVLSAFLRSIIARYTTYGVYLYETESNTYIAVILVFICFYILLSYIYGKAKTNDAIRILFSSVQTALIIGGSVAVLFTPANRLMYYYEAVLVLYVPEALKNIDRKYVKYAMYVLVTAAYVLKIVLYFRGDWYNSFFHYRTIWSV